MKVQSERVLGSRCYSLSFYDGFEAPELDLSHWLDTYLPQWSSFQAGRPRYVLSGNSLVLKIDPDQRPWCPEFNGKVRVSSLQTAVFSGPAGSSLGQHHFAPGLAVREFQGFKKLFAQQYGYFEFRCRCRIQKSNVAAFWLIGLEEQPEQSAEICVFELKGENCARDGVLVGSGLRAFADPSLTNDFREDPVNLDPAEFHVYGMEWTADHVDFFIDGVLTKRINQSPRYPMQMMVNIYELEDINQGTMEMEVDYVAVYRNY